MSVPGKWCRILRPVSPVVRGSGLRGGYRCKSTWCTMLSGVDIWSCGGGVYIAFSVSVPGKWCRVLRPVSPVVRGSGLRGGYRWKSTWCTMLSGADILSCGGGVYIASFLSVPGKWCKKIRPVSPAVRGSGCRGIYRYQGHAVYHAMRCRYIELR